jgi:arylsulfatase
VYHHWLAQPLNRNGVWNVEVARSGHYQFALRRWPRETGTPINAALPEEKWAPRMTRSAALDAAEARIRVGNVERRQEVTGAMQEAAFTLELDAGPTTIRTWFVDDDGSSRGACYLYARRLPAE